MSLKVQAKSENHEEAVKLAAPPVVTARWLARNSRNSRNSRNGRAGPHRRPRSKNPWSWLESWVIPESRH